MGKGANGPVSPGDIFAGKYRIEQILGEGGMGLVVAATHLDLGELRAIKLLSQSRVGPQAQRRFLREARVVALLKSEHVAKVHDVGGFDSGTPHIILEHLEGENLQQLLERCGCLPIETAVDYVLQVVAALDEAHARGIIHRDIKPANLFLAHGPRGRRTIKVLDFGISKLLDPPGDEALTASRAVMGTRPYMSPEQLVSTRDVDARTDIWSLGVVLHELLTGARPAEETRDDELPSALDAVIRRCLEMDPAARFGDVQELGAALLPFASPQGKSRFHLLTMEPAATVSSQPPSTVVVSQPLPEGAQQDFGFRSTVSFSPDASSAGGTLLASKEKRGDPLASSASAPSGSNLALTLGSRHAFSSMARSRWGLAAVVVLLFSLLKVPFESEVAGALSLSLSGISQRIQDKPIQAFMPEPADSAHQRGEGSSAAPPSSAPVSSPDAPASKASASQSLAVSPSRPPVPHPTSAAPTSSSSATADPPAAPTTSGQAPAPNSPKRETSTSPDAAPDKPTSPATEGVEVGFP